MKADIDNLKILKLNQSTLLRLERMSRIQKHIMARVLHPRYKTWTRFQNSRPTRKQQNSIFLTKIWTTLQTLGTNILQQLIFLEGTEPLSLDSY